MICLKCNQRCYLQAISIGTCEICGESTPSPHLPSYTICENCAIKHNLCEQCGKEII